MDSKATQDMIQRRKTQLYQHGNKQGLNDSYMSYTEPEESDYGMMHELNSCISASQLPSHGGYISSGMPIFGNEREAYHIENRPRKKTNNVRTSVKRSSRVELDDTGALTDPAEVTPYEAKKESKVSISKISKSSAKYQV